MNTIWIAGLILASTLPSPLPVAAPEEDVAIACRLASKELRERKAEIKRELEPLVRDVRRVEDGFELFFDRNQETLLTVSTFVGLESECCPFLSFALELPSGEEKIRLRISAGAEAQTVLQQMFEEIAGPRG